MKGKTNVEVEITARDAFDGVEDLLRRHFHLPEDAFIEKGKVFHMVKFHSWEREELRDATPEDQDLIKALEVIEELLNREGLKGYII